MNTEEKEKNTPTPPKNKTTNKKTQPQTQHTCITCAKQYKKK